MLHLFVALSLDMWHVTWFRSAVYRMEYWCDRVWCCCMVYVIWYGKRRFDMVCFGMV